MEQSTDAWVACEHDKWVRWSTVNRIVITEEPNLDYAVRLVTDFGAGENSVVYRTVGGRGAARTAVSELFDGLRR